MKTDLWIATVSALSLAVAVSFTAHAQDSEESDDEQAEEAEDLIRVQGFRSSLAASLETKREANQVLDAITAEEIGQFPDQNITEAVQRISGVQIFRSNGEGEQIQIRGLDPSFTRVEIDGRTTSVTADDSNPGRESSLSSFETDLYQRIEVIKSPTAADIEGGIGGIVRLSTPDPFDFEDRTLRVSGLLIDADQRDDVEPSVRGLFADTIANGRFGFVLSGTYTNRDRSIDKFQSNQNWLDIAANDLADETDPALLALVGGRYPGRLRQEQRAGESDRYNFNAKVQFQASEQLELFANGIYTLDAREERRDRIQVQFSRGELQSGVLDAATGTLVEAQFTDQRTEFASFLREADIETFGLSGGAQWDPQDWSLRFEASYSTSEEDLTETRASHRTNSDDLGGYSVVSDPEYPEIFAAATGLAPDELSVRQLDQEKRLIDSEEIAVQFDAERFVTLGPITSLQTGARWAQTEVSREQIFAEVDAGGLTYADAPSNDPFVVDGTFADGFGGANVLRTWPSVDPVAFFNAFEAGDPDVDDNRFSITEESIAIYGMANFESALSGWTARGNAGLRLTSTPYQGDGRIILTDANGVTTITDDGPDLDNDYTIPLPAFNIVLSPDAREDVLIRGAVTRALSRPSYDALSPVRSINLLEDEAEFGNPDLDPFVAWQYDLGVEYYFGDEAAVTIGLFYKDVEEFIFQESFDTVLNIPELGISNEDVFLTTFTNGGDAEVQGFEVSLQTPFSFLPAPFDGFGVFTNYTYTDSEFTRVFEDGSMATLPFPGSSENAFNIVGYYERGGFSGRVAYNYRDEFNIVPAQQVDDAGNPINAEFGDAQGRLDLALRYRFQNGLRLSFDALNLTEEQNYKYYDIQQRLEDLEVEGRIYQFRIGYVY